MIDIENMRGKENGIIFAPDFGDYDLNIGSIIARNITLWNSKAPNYMKYATRGGIEIVDSSPSRWTESGKPIPFPEI